MTFGPVLDLLPTAVDSQLSKKTGVTQASFYVMLHLSMREGNVTRISDLAACANSTLPRMSRIVARLEDDGLVERSSDDADGRAVNIGLTPAGRSTVTKVTPTHDHIVRKLVFDSLTEEQQRQLRDISAILLARLHPDVASPIDRQHPVE